ncbi:MAG TPA: ABC transporter permease [Acidobacteriaceae bacterium]|jgi:predicted permease|nr:ABC transporter permease [Acidobacteriaceae bacterium]
MRALRAFFRRLRGLLDHRPASDDIAAELDSHVQMHIDDNLRAGMNPEEARRQALIRLGGREQTQQAVRERTTLPWIETFAQDLRFAFRQLRKSPGFTAVVVITLALGIGVNTALFSIVNTVLLHPIALPHPEELVAVDASKPNFEHGSVSYPNFRDWQRDNRSFAAFAVFRHMGWVVTGNGEAERVHGDFVSSNFFSGIGVKPVAGRLFAPGEDEIGHAPLALIAQGFWARKFGSDPGIVGRAMILDGRAFTIIGVIPASFDLNLGSFRAEDVYVPIGQWDTGALKNRGAGLGIHGIARLKPGVTLAQARADMYAVSDHLAAVYPEDDHGLRASLTPLRDVIVGNVQPILLVLLAAVGFVLLIACVNVANLLLARASSRAQEFGVRLALGASRKRIIRQLLTETTLLALGGGALGLLLAAWGTGAALRLAPAALPRAAQIHLSPLVLCFTFLISVAVGIFFGLVPAWNLATQQPQNTLREGGRGIRGSRHRVQDWLVIFEMAAALVLLAGAGLMIRSLVALSGTDPGFQSNGILTFSLSAPYSPGTATPAGATAWVHEVDRRIASVPGVTAVSFVDGSVPMTGDDDEELFWLQNEPKPSDTNDMHWALRYMIEPDYLKVMRIPLLHGRFFTDADRGKTPPVAVIDEDFAHQFFGEANPIGQVLNLTDPDQKATVVGVVGHIMQWGLDNDAGFPLHAQIYRPYAQINDGDGISAAGMTTDIVIRADHPDTVFPDIQAAMHRMNAQPVAYGAKTMNQIIADTLAARRFSMILLGAFAALALLLAVVGLYGVISYLVGQRTQEMAIRMALGADCGNVLRWVLRRGAALAGIGVAAGTIAALLVTHFMATLSLAKSSILYGVRPWDPVTMIGVIAILMTVALAASYIPARRAASVDPMRALRSE